ncbi:hypothetical protein [Sphingobium ummariense]|uniref:Uncharacterized protein n=1 Tax=Sphingobium ummariense RL-3 TaxID=1346791 RepID=T0KA97_9SPHN|nr:hypothetical protein [Sphingobium ummariense]EQB30338.1 hypothetical protein M529_20300 [Sphingobium ummariense RL-3]
MPYAYFTEAGQLLVIASAQANYPDPTIIEVAVAEGTMPNAIYLELATMTVKQRQPFDLSVSHNRIGGLPAGTSLVMGDTKHVIEDGTAEFEADTVETIYVNLSHPHYLDQYVAVPTGPETP